jgi:hypothetical protein
MGTRKRWVAVAAPAVAAGVALALAGGRADAHPHGLDWDGVPANTKSPGVTSPNTLSAQLAEHAVAQGSVRLENGTAELPYYGYNGNGPLLPAPGDVPAQGHQVEAQKTEPDKNTYLRLRGLHGADPAYDYGTRFLFQGHEAGAGFLSRINLDADAAHRVTLLATKDVNGNPLPDIDGSTWDPWARRLLFTSEGNARTGGVWQSTPDVNAQVKDISPVLGRGGYEGIQNDSAGNLWIVEDSGGASPAGSTAKNPNSFVYRFIPVDRTDLTRGGKLQALRVLSRRSHQPITFQAIDAAHPTGGIFTDDERDLTNYGPGFETRWVTVHDTATDHSGVAFDSNALAKAAGATPFKRPENGQFRPGTGFGEFYFDATGDTNATSPANAGYGGWGGVYRLNQVGPTADRGTLTVFYAGDQAHTGVDNVAFVDRDHVAFVEDAGDTLHTQRNALDSAYLFDVRHDYGKGGQPVRFLAEGRDPSATLDSALGAFPGFNNDGDNEITGIHVSDGDPTTGGILGARDPHPFTAGWRLFWTQQHGDNTTWEITPNN